MSALRLLMEGNEPLAFTLALLAGLSTSVGALVAFFVKTTNKRFLAGALGFSAGVMSLVSFVEIYAEARVSFGHAIGEKHATAATVGCFYAGVALAALLDVIVHRLDPSHASGHNIPTSVNGELDSAEKLVAQQTGPEHSDSVNEGSHLLGDDRTQPQQRETTTVSFLKHPVTWLKQDWKGFDDQSKEGTDLKITGFVTALAIAIHNFPEGLATFVATLANPGVGLSLAVAIAIHNIPEGISVAMPIYYATGSRMRGFLWASLSGLSEPLGAGVGWAIVSLAYNQIMFGILFGVVAGMMVFISIKELLPSAHQFDREDVVTSWSFIGGMILMSGSLLLFEYVAP